LIYLCLFSKLYQKDFGKDIEQTFEQTFVLEGGYNWYYGKNGFTFEGLRFSLR